ncbi:MAG: flagellar hook-basal body complex protein, partial [Rhodospirillaceae bacterium]|nr:flagellar hook-basal body complex protein [Rhodospirillaceae bacterium]
TIQQIDTLYSAYSQFTLGGVPTDADTLIINGITYEFDTNAAYTSGNVQVDISAADISVDDVLAALEAAIETNDANYPSGTNVRLRADGGTNAIDTNERDTLVLNSLSSSFTVDASNMSVSFADPYGTNYAASGTTATVVTTAGIQFSSQGQPADINVVNLQIDGFTNGAAGMDDAIASRLAIDFGTVGETDGMTQFGSEYTPTFIQQNGSRFGSFAGVSFGSDGIVTALFDNGDTRPVYKVPIATFINPNGLEGRTGNVWNASEGSGDYTLRTAGNGPAGVVTQGSLEASTVDIGAEFTNMIVVQRAYSASTKIISTADQMLEELMRTKR